MGKSFKKKAKGITLVALVVTIVVLLILAGVSLNLLLGENGLITKAKDARTKAAEDQKNMEDGMKSLADEIDDITENDGNVKINYEIEKTESRAVILKLKRDNNIIAVRHNNEEIFDFDNVKLCDCDSEYVYVPITRNNEYTIIAQIGEEEYIEKKINITECETEKYSKICDKNTTLNIDGYELTVPAGFAYGESDNVKSVNNGFVITDSIDEDGNSNGNEFVWIPVSKENLTIGKTNKVMAKISNGTNYEGILYDFEGITSVVKTNYGVDTNSNREPTLLEVDDTKYNYNTIGMTEETLQEEYNDMIASIQKYGGFYVARYELAIENDKAISKIASYPASSGWGGNGWYKWYKASKTYKNDKDSVVASMIWGSQYDAMLNFALEGNDKEKVTSMDYGYYNWLSRKL